MKHPSLALLALFFLCTVAHGQSVARVTNFSAASTSEGTADQVLVTRAMLLLQRLDDDVIVYRSLGEFQESGKLARVSLEDFKSHLREAGAEIQSLSSLMKDGRLKTEMHNALASYRDGAFWWEQVYQPRVVNISSLTPESSRTQPDAFLLANAPYTVAIHWRQAHKYLQRAVTTLNVYSTKLP
jgi:hypothetical protein